MTRNYSVRRQISDVSFAGISATKGLQRNSITLEELVREVLPLLSHSAPNIIEAIPVFTDWGVRDLKGSMASLRNFYFKKPTNYWGLKSRAKGYKLPTHQLTQNLSEVSLLVPLTSIETDEFYQGLPASHPQSSLGKFESSCSPDLISSCWYPKHRYSPLVHTISGYPPYTP